VTIIRGSLDAIALGQAQAAEPGTDPDRDLARRLRAAGMTERQIAKRLRISPSTAHRWLAAASQEDAAPAAPPVGDPAGPDPSVTPVPGETPETLAALRDRRDRLALQHGALLDQAQAAREAVEDCDTRRMDALAGGGDSARFAAERARLEAEHARLAQDAGDFAKWFRPHRSKLSWPRQDRLRRCSGPSGGGAERSWSWPGGPLRLGVVGPRTPRGNNAGVVGRWFGLAAAEISRREAEHARRTAQADAEAARAERERAYDEGGELAPVCKDQLRACVLGELAPAELAHVASRLDALGRAAGRTWDMQVLPPAIPRLGVRDEWHSAVVAVWGAAKEGNWAMVKVLTGRLGGTWYDRDPAAARGAAPGLVVGGTAVDGPQPDATGLAANQMPAHWPASVSLDEHGRPLPQGPPNRHPSGLPVWR
jgi:hypothetical protein